MKSLLKKVRMRSLFRKAGSANENFADDESGAVTVEFVLWVPVFVLILAITVDATVLFMTQANLWSIARDTTRLMAARYLTDAEAEAYALDRMARWGGDTAIDASHTANYATVSFTVPVASVSPFNIVTAFTSGNLGVSLSQHMEPE